MHLCLLQNTDNCGSGSCFLCSYTLDFGQHFLLHFRRRKRWGGKMQQHKQEDGRPTLRLQRRFCSADRCATLLCSMCTPTLTPSPSPSSRPNGGGDDWKDCNNQLPITAMQHSPSHSHLTSSSHTVTCLAHHTITCLAHHKINCLVDHKITSLVHHTATCLVHHMANCLVHQSLD